MSEKEGKDYREKEARKHPDDAGDQRATNGGRNHAGKARHPPDFLRPEVRRNQDAEEDARPERAKSKRLCQQNAGESRHTAEQGHREHTSHYASWVSRAGPRPRKFLSAV